MLIKTSYPPKDSLRDSITKAYRMDETECVQSLLKELSLSSENRARINQVATNLVNETRANRRNQNKLNSLLQKYNLSSEEGIALMCLAEALLRIPDTNTMDKFISDKLSTVDWKNHLNTENSFFINATTWSLLLTGKIYAPTLEKQESLVSSLRKALSGLGIVMVRPVILQIMRAMGRQFVMGEDIQSAIKRAKEFEEKGYRFSYDMLGEAARTMADADVYIASYFNAIENIGKTSTRFDDPKTKAGISIKLSALYPRYEYTHYDEAIQHITPILLKLALEAKKYNIGLTVDAEEADRLDLSLDIFARVFEDPALGNWQGLGLAVQAYQKRARYVIDWLINLAKKNKKTIMVRLVKGAYWDSEIKVSQINGFNSYPVFTRKHSTDLSYLACAQKLLANTDCLFPQFGTHNAYTVAAILEMAGSNKNYEFQCLHGMGETLYDQLVKDHAVRIYAPVGTHKDLLGYLVRRLLENGANSSFLNLVADDKIPVETIIVDPVKRIASLPSKPHPKIPLPKDIYGHWQNSEGLDLSNLDVQKTFKEKLEAACQNPMFAASIINGKKITAGPAQSVVAPSDGKVLGTVHEATEKDLLDAIDVCEKGFANWSQTHVNDRALILEKAANLFQERMPELIAAMTREGGKTILDCLGEVRETIDYCRYYAYRARIDLTPHLLPGPTGESNELSLHPRGIVACISPWNFPLAIFSGQVLAALVTGNTVIAKPAEQTPLVAYKAVEILLEAGIPKDALQLVIGQGDTIGANLVKDPRIAGVMFTGSTATAKSIEKSLANREGPIAFLIAETGGQNAMIVDSSALIEQAVIDIAQSAFNSAGQRCSALRVLFVQDDLAPLLIKMLQGYMATLKMGEPSLLNTDIGPVIDQDALNMLNAHAAEMTKKGKLIAQVELPAHLDAGHYFAPRAFEIDDLATLKGEVFGPILHIIRYPANNLEKVMDSITKTGFGLTLGIESRIDATVQYVTSRMPVGNTYVNRNMIGAVVGVQPFGGERLSGTGPKAGGPHYLPRLCVERSQSINTTAVGGNARLVSLLEED